MEDKVVGAHVTFMPCGMNGGEVVGADIVVDGELYHVSKGRVDKCNDCVWELMEWLQTQLIRVADKGVFYDSLGRMNKLSDEVIKLAEARAIAHHVEGKSLWEEKAEQIRVEIVKAKLML